MSTRSAYGSEVTRRAQRVVVDIFAALGHRAEHAVLIGGAKLLPYTQDSEVVSALAFLGEAFGSPDAAGSVAVARFQEAEREEAHRLSAQAYAVVQSFLGGFHGGDS